MTLQRSRRVFRGAGAILVLAFFASGCQLADWAPGGQFRPWYCDPTDTAVNDGHDGDDHMAAHYTEEKGPLSSADCLNLNVKLSQATKYASQFPSAGVAEANGWHHLAPYVPGQGTHHVNIARGVTDQFDPKRPNMLMYDGNSDSAKLTGMVWVVKSGPHPPAGFAGNNDQWHYHEKLCYVDGPFIVGDNITDAACANLGGINQDSSDTWLLHVWLPTYEGWQATDIFNKTHPSV
jgi:hypothetical protein